MVRLKRDGTEPGTPGPKKPARRIRVWRDAAARATGPDGTTLPDMAGAGLFPACAGRGRLERALRKERRAGVRGEDYSPTRHLALARLARRSASE